MKRTIVLRQETREYESRDEGQQHVVVSQTSRPEPAMPPTHRGIHLPLLVRVSRGGDDGPDTPRQRP